MLPSSLFVIYVGSIFVELSIFMYVCMAINLFDFDFDFDVAIDNLNPLMHTHCTAERM